MSAPPILRRVALEELIARRQPVDGETLAAAGAIVADVRARGERALREYAGRFDGLGNGGELFLGRETLDAARTTLDPSTLALLERTAARIRAFAAGQRAVLGEFEIAVPGGRAGHAVAPVERAGCYAPGGRFPLPSSVLMTAVTARAAGVATVWVASPHPAPAILAAAAVAGADGVIAAGGAHAIAALAFGAGPVPAADVVVGPGNRWVTAAKQLVAGTVRIDMLAGPSELVVLADRTAEPAVIAADLLAQAEHDPDAVPVLVTTDAGLATRVEGELERQLVDLPTAPTARAALRNGGVVLVHDLAEGVTTCDRLAPEHLEVIVEDAPAVSRRLRNYGGLFVGGLAAEVIGDYGAGPNHVLPTGGTARCSGGLSVFDFLRVRTWLRLDDPEGAFELARDAAALARVEGLEGHARAAEMRAP